MRNITKAAAKAITYTNRFLMAQGQKERNTVRPLVIEALRNLSWQMRTDPMTEADLELLRDLAAGKGGDR